MANDISMSDGKVRTNSPDGPECTAPLWALLLRALLPGQTLPLSAYFHLLLCRVLFSLNGLLLVTEG